MTTTGTTFFGMSRTFPAAAAAFGAVLALGAGLASAQLTPDRVYYGVRQKMPMRAALPEGTPADASADVVITLRSPEGDVLETAPAALGGVDLAGLFPRLWTSEQPTVLYAQLEVGGRPIGSAVVLQPMLSVDTATLRGNKAVFTSELSAQSGRPWAPVYAGIRAYPDKHAVLETSEGEIEIRLRPEKAPNTAWSFRELVAGGFYTEIIFHRVVETLDDGRPFVVQVGDPTGTGAGGPGFNIDLEKSDLLHDFGIVSMARSGDPNSGGSQFFICLSREGTSFLDGNYTGFGECVRGAEAIVAISKTPVDESDRPSNPPVLKSARLVDAPPMGSVPARVQRPAAAPVER